MAITLTEKMAKKVDERFKLGALSAKGVNQDYEWQGVKTIKVTSIPTVPLNDYKRTGTNRFGTPTELDNALQDLTLQQDKSFTFTVDKMNEEETMIKASEALRRQIDEVVIPAIDTHRFKVMAENGQEITIGNVVYDSILDASEKLDDAKVPAGGRVLFVSNSLYKELKKDTSFVLASELGMEVKIKGQVGEIDGNIVVKVPSTYLPDGVKFILTHPSAVVGPVKLAEYRILNEVPGISGSLVEGRVYYDAFALNSKKKAIVVGKQTA